MHKTKVERINEMMGDAEVWVKITSNLMTESKMVDENQGIRNFLQLFTQAYKFEFDSGSSSRV